ncbi:MAG: alpha-amylase family glycosyl hydrolase [Candidatus Omnitrophica bacterium]|nr:alpha-amylase family glycosyl hydrolase [Candidatus Omnitrophota bacterium]
MNKRILTAIAVLVIIIAFAGWQYKPKPISKAPVSAALAERTWLNDGAIYETHPYYYPNHSFREITDDIPRIADLGVKTIYILPVWEHQDSNPPQNYIYLITNYSRLDPLYGTGAELKELVNTAHNYNMKVIFDLVTCCASWKSIPFVNNWTLKISLSELRAKAAQLGWKLQNSTDGNGNKYTYYNCRAGYGGQNKCDFLGKVDGDVVTAYYYPIATFGPAIDRTNPDAVNYFVNAAEYSVKEYGIDGWRLDVPNNHWNPDIFSDEHSSLQMLRNAKALMQANKPNVVFFAELPYLDPSDSALDEVAEASYSHGFSKYVFYKLIPGQGSSKELVDLLQLENEKVEYGRTRSRMVEEHGSQRLANSAPKLNKPLLVLISTIPGIPMIQAGQEIGATEEWFYNGKAQAQVNWSKGDYALRDFYKKVFAIRNSNNVLKYGDIKNVWKSGDNIYAYSRTYGNETVIIAINFNGNQAESILEVPFEKGTRLTDELSGETFTVEIPSSFKITIPAYSPRILTIEGFAKFNASPNSGFSGEKLNLGPKGEETLVIAGIPQMNLPNKGVSKPSWKEIEAALPQYKDIGVNTIFIWTPYEAIWPEEGRTMPVKTEKGIENIGIKNSFIVKDYLKTDPERGTEEEFLHMVQTAHSLGIKVIAQLQITVTAPGTFVYENHPDWMLKSIYGEPAIFWPWGITQYGYVVNKADPGLINYVTDTILPLWIKKWDVDGVYLDSGGMAYCDSYIKNLCDKSSYAEGFECLTPVDGYFSPEPLTKAMREKIEELGKETGKNLIFAGEIPFLTARDMPDDIIIKTCNGDVSGWWVDPGGNRTLGKYFDWVQGYNFRGLLKLVYEGKLPHSDDYVSTVKLVQNELEGKYAKTAKFVNMWVEAHKFAGLLNPDVSNPYITLVATAPGNIIWIGEYQIILNEEIAKRLGYKPDILKEQYKKLIAIKKAFPALQSDNIEDALISPKIPKLIAYNRWEGDGSVTVIVNIDGKPVDAVVKTRFSGNDVAIYDLLSGETFSGDPQNLKIGMASYGSRILTIRQAPPRSPLQINNILSGEWANSKNDLRNVKSAIVYESITEGPPIGKERSTDEIIGLLKETGADLIFRGFWRWGVAVESPQDIPPEVAGVYAGRMKIKPEEVPLLAEKSGYNYAELEKRISAIKKENPGVIFVGATGAQRVNRIDRNDKTGKIYSQNETWAMALDPRKWDIQRNGKPFTKEEFQALFADWHGWAESGQYDPGKVQAYFPDITNPDYQELLLSWAYRQIDAGADAIWIDGLPQTPLIYPFVKDVNHPVIKDFYEASQKIIDGIHKYGRARGKYIYVGSWGIPIKFTEGMPYMPPNIDFVTISPAEKEIEEKNISQSYEKIANIRKIYGNTPVFAFIDWGIDPSPTTVFSQTLSKEEQGEMLRFLDVSFAKKGVNFIYPLHGGYLELSAKKLAFGKYRNYDSLAPEFGTYETIKELAQKKK